VAYNAQGRSRYQFAADAPGNWIAERHDVMSGAKVSSSSWLACRRPRRSPTLRLLTIPPAGSGPGVYADWGEALPDGIEVWSVVAPGREVRYGEPVPPRLQDHVDDIAVAIQLLSNVPFAVFGHSMGAVVAFELARHLARKGRKPPEQLFLSGARGFSLPRNRELEHVLSDHALADAVRLHYGGFPAEVEAHADLLALALTALRADLAALESHQRLPGPLLSIPIAVLGGSADPSVSVEDLRAWAAETSGAFTLKVFSGNHRYLESQRPAVVAWLGEILRSLAARLKSHNSAARRRPCR
jgi:surfactin synthase thioesterase subunit